MRSFVTAVLVLLSTCCACAQSDAPSFDEVFRQIPPAPQNLDFLLLGWTTGARLGSIGTPLNGVYRVGPGITAPKPLKTPDPNYPEELRRNRVQGTVSLSVVVGPDGLVHDVKIKKRLGYGLDEKAIQAVRTWRFKPAMKDGLPVWVEINIDVNFRVY